MSQYEKINLDDYVLSGEGGQGLAYTHKSEKRLAKLFNVGFDTEEAIREFEMARAAYDAGVPTPKPFRLITDGERVGTEFELVENKRSFSRIISQQPERMQEIATRFAKDCRALHALPADVSHIPSMKRRMQEFYARDGVVPAFMKERILPVLEHIPDTPRCIHGDMHIGNIITDGERDLWIDIGQFAYGAPEWDLSICWRVSQIADSGMLENLFHLTPEQMKQQWGIFACAYHGVSPQDLGSCVRQYMPYAAIKSSYMYYLTYHRPVSDEMAQRIITNMLGPDA